MKKENKVLTCESHQTPTLDNQVQTSLQFWEQEFHQGFVLLYNDVKSLKVSFDELKESSI